MLLQDHPHLCSDMCNSSLKDECTNDTLCARQLSSGSFPLVGHALVSWATWCVTSIFHHFVASDLLWRVYKTSNMSPICLYEVASSSHLRMYVCNNVSMNTNQYPDIPPCPSFVICRVGLVVVPSSMCSIPYLIVHYCWFGVVGDGVPGDHRPIGGCSVFSHVRCFRDPTSLKPFPVVAEQGVSWDHWATCFDSICVKGLFQPFFCYLGNYGGGQGGVWLARPLT